MKFSKIECVCKILFDVFRVFVTKLEQHQSVADLPPPQDSTVYSYQEVHYSKRGGTYLADMFER